MRISRDQQQYIFLTDSETCVNAFQSSGTEINLVKNTPFYTLLLRVLCPWFSVIFSVWDCFLYEGSILLFRIALGVLSINKDLVLNQASSEGIFTEVRDKSANIFVYIVCSVKLLELTNWSVFVFGIYFAFELTSLNPTTIFNYTKITHKMVGFIESFNIAFAYCYVADCEAFKL